MNQNIQKQREAHHKALERLTGKPGLQVWRKLRRLEAEAHAMAERRCNDPDVSLAEANNTYDRVSEAVAALGVPQLYLNTDPRGYALKLPEGAPDYGLHRDFGGYQILAPENG